MSCPCPQGHDQRPYRGLDCRLSSRSWFSRYCLMKYWRTTSWSKTCPRLSGSGSGRTSIVPEPEKSWGTRADDGLIDTMTIVDTRTSKMILLVLIIENNFLILFVMLFRRKFFSFRNLFLLFREDSFGNVKIQIQYPTFQPFIYPSKKWKKNMYSNSYVFIMIVVMDMYSLCIVKIYIPRNGNNPTKDRQDVRWDKM